MEVQLLSADLDPPMPEQNPDGVDVTQIQDMLDMEPIDRLRYMQAFVTFIWRVHTLNRTGP